MAERLASTLVVWAACVDRPQPLEPPVQQGDVTVEQPATVDRYDVIDIGLRHRQSYPNPWEDVAITATFRGPRGEVATVGGFYYDTGVWRLRFAPRSAGNWTWSGTFTTPSGDRPLTGSFTVASGTNRGRVRRSGQNPNRFAFDDGSLFYPLGFGDCTFDSDHSGSPNDTDWGLDGGFRPPGQEAGTTVSLDAYLTAYGNAGFDFFRWSVDNCAYKLWQTIDPAGNTYLVREGKWGDELVQKFRNRGFRLMLVFFGFQPAFRDETADNARMAAVKRYIKYAMDRYGAYVDFYELMNEVSATNQWYQIVTDFIRNRDPYSHLISTSCDPPGYGCAALTATNVNTPHWYEQENELNSDARAADMVTYAKSFGKPVVFGEQGNGVQNWDPRSGVRMRLRNWAAFFSEGSLLFWNASWARDYRPTNGAANLYIGSEERGYIRVLRDFVNRFDGAGVLSSMPAVDAANVRQYVLASPRQVMIYLVHYTDHQQPVSGRSLTVNVPPGAVGGEWIDPATGTVVSRFSTGQGLQTFSIPAFTIDLALIVN